MSKLEIVGTYDGSYPIGRDADIETWLQHRHLWLRTLDGRRMLLARAKLLSLFRSFYESKGLIELTPPAITRAECEGGSTLFKMDFYGKPAYLTQSSQLYLEAVLHALEKVFCIAPSFRAEKSDTSRHLCEYTHVEAEISFLTYEQLLEHIEDLIIFVSQGMKDAGFTHPDFQVPSKPFKRMTYKECIEYCIAHHILQQDGTPFEYRPDDPIDITDKPEKEMVASIGEPVFMMKFPAVMKSFYMARTQDDQGQMTWTESVDLIMPGVGEIVGSSMRIHDYDELLSAIEKQGLDRKDYEWYLDVRKFGTPKSGGYGLGLERLLCWMLGITRVKDAIPFPRAYKQIVM